MNPLYIGTRGRRLFGIHEPPAVKAGRARAAVLCYPWGSEYLFAHRTLRQLAVRLCGAGFHTLRFDFFGTGDSSGDMLDADLAGWEGDTESAVEGIKDIAEMVHKALATAQSEQFAKPGDYIVIAAGMPFGSAGTTNLLHILQVTTEPESRLP